MLETSANPFDPERGLLRIKKKFVNLMSGSTILLRPPRGVKLVIKDIYATVRTSTGVNTVLPEIDIDNGTNDQSISGGFTPSVVEDNTSQLPVAEGADYFVTNANPLRARVVTPPVGTTVLEYDFIIFAINLAD